MRAQAEETSSNLGNFALRFTLFFNDNNYLWKTSVGCVVSPSLPLLLCLINVFSSRVSPNHQRVSYSSSSSSFLKTLTQMLSFFSPFLHTPPNKEIFHFSTNEAKPLGSEAKCCAPQSHLETGAVRQWEKWLNNWNSPQRFLQSTGWWSNNFPKSTEHLTQKVLEGRDERSKERWKERRKEGGMTGWSMWSRKTTNQSIVRLKPEEIMIFGAISLVKIKGSAIECKVVTWTHFTSYSTCRLQKCIIWWLSVSCKTEIALSILLKDTITVLCFTMWHYMQFLCEM